ncbi:MAG: 50S ribosomal protein L28 [Desulfurellaceae bacterium]|jgi:large subunit ribosomal protein L28|nr:50S ribosomal protein L28 [Desulfurellaceae bacterium]
MARKCDVCGKKPIVGFKVSHSNRKTKRRWLPNLHKMKVLVDGKVKKINVCMKCLKAGKVEKYVRV